MRRHKRCIDLVTVSIDSNATHPLPLEDGDFALGAAHEFQILESNTAGFLTIKIGGS